MGNFQSINSASCGVLNIGAADEFALRYASGEVDNIEKKGKGSTANSRARLERWFLQPHKEERAPRRILDTKEVAKAFAMQAEELLKRERDEEENSRRLNGVQIDGEGEGEAESIFRDDASALTASTLAYSIATRSAAGKSGNVSSNMSAVTAATPQRSNGNSKCLPRGRSAKKNKKPPKLRSGKFLAETQKIQAAIKEELFPTPQQALGVSNLINSSQYILDQDSICTDMLTLFESDDKIKLMRKVRKHMEVIHLKMQPHCVKYHNSKSISRLMPNNPVTQAVSLGNLRSPPRDSSPDDDGTRLSRATLSDSSSSSLSTDIGFGAAPPSSPVRLLVTQTVFMDLAVTGCFGLVDRKRTGSEQRHQQQPSSLRRRRLKSPDEFLVLLNRRSGVPIAVGALKAQTIPGAPPGGPYLCHQTTRVRPNCSRGNRTVRSGLVTIVTIVYVGGNCDGRAISR